MLTMTPVAILYYNPFMSRFQIFSAAQIQSLRKGGAILRDCLKEVARQTVAGVTTGELDRIAEEFIRARGGVPAFLGYHDYPASLCVSVNAECVHGIPGERKIADGDIVSLDCGVIFDDLYTDACVSVLVGNVDPQVRKLAEATEQSLNAACKLVRAGIRVGDISACIQKTVEAAGFHCMHGLTGHGLGTTLHQFPDVPNQGEEGTGPILPPNTLIAIEPITSIGTEQIRQEDDGWTISSADNSPTAHFEHTVLVLQDGAEIIV